MNGEDQNPKIPTQGDYAAGGTGSDDTGDAAAAGDDAAGGALDMGAGEGTTPTEEQKPADPNAPAV